MIELKKEGLTKVISFTWSEFSLVHLKKGNKADHMTTFLEPKPKKIPAPIPKPLPVPFTFMPPKSKTELHCPISTDAFVQIFQSLCFCFVNVFTMP